MSKNKIKYNLKNVYAAILTKNGNSYTYATPTAIPGAVSMSLDAEGDANPFYADGIVYFRSSANNGYSGDLEIALIPEWFREQVLRETKDTNGVFIETSDISEPVYFALLFEFDGDQKAIRHVLYNCSVSKRPTLASQTKEASIEPGTETLSLTADPREDGLVKARTGDDTDNAVYTTWYSAVYVPASSAPSFAKLTSLSIGSVTLSPTFNADVVNYTAETSNATNTVTAAGASGTTVTITVNGTSHTSGGSATWTAGDNLVVVTVSKAGQISTAYTVTVTKSSGG